MCRARVLFALLISLVIAGGSSMPAFAQSAEANGGAADNPPS